MRLKPIWNNRQLVGHAASAAAARRIVAGLLQTVPPGWKITVRERDTALIDLPAGFIFSVHP